MARNDKRIDQLKPSENALKSTDLFAMYSDNRTEQQPLSNVIDYLQSTINTSYFTGGTINGTTTFTDTISACTSTVYINTLSPCGGAGSTMTFSGSLDVSGQILSGGTDLTTIFSTLGGGGDTLWTSGGTSNNATLSILGGNVINGGSTSSVIAGEANTLGANSSDSTDGSYIFANGSSIVSGGSNTIIGTTSGNITNSNYSGLIAGLQNNIVDGQDGNVIIGGAKNDLTSGLGTVMVGTTACSSDNSNYSVVLGGQSNVIDDSTNSTVLGGAKNQIYNSNRSVVVGGVGRIDDSDSSAIISCDDGNITTGTTSTLVGGSSNFITSTNSSYGVYGSSVLGGDNNTITDTSITTYWSVILGGERNILDSSNNSVILGGSGNTLNSNQSVILGGIGIDATSDNTVYTPNLEITGQANTPVHNSGSGTTFTLDFNNSNIQTITVTGNTTMNNPTNVKDGAVYTVIIKQGATTGTINSWDTNFKFESGTAPTLTTTAYSVDIITFISDDAGILYGLPAFDFQ